MRALALLGMTLAAASGCQCFVPVDEPDGGLPEDAGTDAGRDAGLPDAGGADAGEPDAGQGDGGCLRATQCTGGPQPTANQCFGSDAGFSCVQNTCLWECPISTTAGRSCIVDMGSYCLRCGDDGGTTCPMSGTTACGGPVTMGTATVESAGAACATWPGTSLPFTDVDIMRTASAQCRYLLGGAGQSLGEVWKLDGYEYLAFFPGLGGWCTGRSAFTGAPRSIFSCPACQFVLMGFE